MQILIDLFGINGLIPHGYCLSWSPFLLWLHVISDVLITLAYYSIPLILIYFIRQRKDLPYPWLFVLFAGFIVACGTTHLLSAITIWIPLYWLDGLLKGITAIISIATAVLMFWLVPRALSLPSAAQLFAEIQLKNSAELAQLETLDKLQKISDQLPGLVFQFCLRADGSSCLPYASKVLYDIYQVTPEEVRDDASKLFAVVHPDDIEAHLASIQTSARDLSPWRNEYRLRFADGKECWLFGNALPQLEVDGSVIWHGFVTDITEQREREHQFGLYQRLFELTSDCVYIISPKQDFKFVFVNDATCRHYGVEREQLLKWRIPDWDFNFKKQSDLDALWQEIKTKKGFLLETVHHIASGIEIPVEVSGSYLSYQGEEYIAGYFHDISDRKKIEDVTKASEQYTRSLLEASLDPLVTINSEGKITDVNSATEIVTGVDRNMLIGNDFANYFTDPENARKGYQQVFSQGLVTNYPLAIRHVSGKITSVLYNASVYHDDKGMVRGVFASARDITESELIEKALITSEILFKTMFNEAPLGIALIDSLTNQVYSVNPMFAKIAGRTLEEMVDIDWASITHPDDVQEDLDNMALMNAEEISGFQMEMRYLHPNRTPIWINMTIAPIYVEDKTHPRHLCMIEDITERKQIQQALQKESEKNIALLRNASDGIHILDYDGNILEVSDSFCTMLGYSREEVIGMNISQWDAHFTAVECLQILNQQFTSPTRNLFETLHRRKNGTLIDVEISGSTLELGGKQVLFNSSRDITARKASETSLRKLSLAVEQSPSLIIITDIQANIEYVNETFCKITGYRSDEVIGKNPRLLHSGKTPKATHDEMWAALNVGEVWKGELINKTKTGDEYIEAA